VRRSRCWRDLRPTTIPPQAAIDAASPAFYRDNYRRFSGPGRRPIAQAVAALGENLPRQLLSGHESRLARPTGRTSPPRFPRLLPLATTPPRQPARRVDHADCTIATASSIRFNEQTDRRSAKARSALDEPGIPRKAALHQCHTGGPLPRAATATRRASGSSRRAGRFQRRRAGPGLAVHQPAGDGNGAQHRAGDAADAVGSAANIRVTGRVWRPVDALGGDMQSRVLTRKLSQNSARAATL